MKKLRKSLLVTLTVTCLFPKVAFAQSDQPAGSSVNYDDIVVTATKRAGGTVQNVPIAITAYDSDALAAREFKGLGTLAYSTPGVIIQQGGTVPGTSNIAIRGIGVSSTIPSIDPAVGIFVDGVYMGINAGTMFDMFDVEQIELLRGPQGVLFGKNVTAGAVLVQTTLPTNQFKSDTQASIESGVNFTASSVVSGPLIGDVVQAKIAAYYNHDEGWFTNDVDGKNFGGGKRFIVHGALRYTPTSAVDVILRFDHGRNQENDGVISRNPIIYGTTKGHHVSATPGAGGGNSTWNFGVLEGNLDVGFGSGKITNIIAYREFDQTSRSDVDGQAPLLFHATTVIAQHQFSEELRYAGTFGKVDVTTGLYYFNQNIGFVEGRLRPTTSQSGGGVQKTHTYSAFAAADWHLTDTFGINLGGRYNSEKKQANITSLGLNRCDIATRVCVPEFSDAVTFNSFIPKVGFQWQPKNDVHIYGVWTKGVRSGGYNVRNSIVGAKPGPYGDESVSSFEIGFKSYLFDRRIRLNGSVFRYKFKDAQHTVSFPDPIVGNTQLIRNSADETLRGIELETTVKLIQGLSLNAAVGYTHGRYDRVFADLNLDGAISSKDRDLNLPFLAPLAYSLGGSYETDVKFGQIRARVDYAYADPYYFCDSNANCTLSSAKDLSASISVALVKHITAAIYGKNLLNDVMENSISQFGGSLGSLVAINKGRVIGASLRFRY